MFSEISLYTYNILVSVYKSIVRLMQMILLESYWLGTTFLLRDFKIIYGLGADLNILYFVF
jgi:hypothetical protein